MKIYKFILVLSILAMVVQNGYSKNLFISGMDLIDTSANIQDTWEIQVHASVTNTSPQLIKVKVKVEVIEIPFGHSYGACWAGGCLAASTLSWDNSAEYSLPGDSTMPQNTFVGHYYCNYKDGPCTPGQGKFRYTFYDVSNPQDFVEVNATLSFYDGLGISEGLSLPELSVSCNPDNILRISSSNPSSNYKLTLLSVNGAILESKSFSGEINQNIGNYTTGIYLYTVISGTGQIIAKGKILKS